MQVVTPPQYYDWCAAVWLLGPESLPPVSVSRLVPQIDKSVKLYNHGEGPYYY